MKGLIEGLGVLTLLGVAIFALIHTFASLEAKAFNNVTGSNVTAFEAMFLDLRVDCSTLSLRGDL